MVEDTDDFYTDPDYLDQGFLGVCSEVSKLCAQIGANPDDRRLG